jgi:EAL domain-containing protein (putative c-di-GMP-specific phosphodiesterase class I)
MLDNLPVDVIKLDMEFMRMNNVDQKKNIRIVESTIHMAKSLGLAIITEGVETSDKVDFLRSIGCTPTCRSRLEQRLPCYAKRQA